MFQIFKDLNIDPTTFSAHAKIGLARGLYQDQTLTAISYKKDNTIISGLLFENDSINKVLNKSNQIFTWNLDNEIYPNILDISLMCYQYHGITKPQFTDMVAQYVKCSYDNSQINALRRTLKQDSLIPYYVSVSDLCNRAKIYLQLGDSLYSEFNNHRKTFYCHLLKAKKSLMKIRNNQIFIDKPCLLNFLKDANSKNQKIGNQILKRLNNNKFIQYLDITGTVTGRIVGTGGVNLQTLPKNVGFKRCIKSRFKEGNILVADWNAMEFRIALAEAKYIDLTKDDIHTETAKQLFQKEKISFDERERAKTINFSIIYSGFANKNASVIKKLYPSLNKKVQQVIKEAQQTKKQINIFGRQRIFKKDTFFQTKAFNNLIQGTAADICLRALYLIQEEIEKNNLESKIILAVHDSIVFDCKYSEIKLLLKFIQNIMTNKAIPGVYREHLLFPVVVEVGKNYEDLSHLATIYKDEVSK